MANVIKVIGFAREYYTLWNMVGIERFETVEGVRICVGTEWKYNYIQNLSKDEEKALEKVEKIWGIKDPEIDEHLRGISSRSFSRYEQRALPYTVFPFGKLMFQEIATADDAWQLMRVFDGEGAIGGGKEFGTLTRVKRRVLARKRLIELGELTKVGSEWLTKKQIEHRNRVEQSEWLHKEGERLDLNLKQVHTTHFETAYGTTFVVTYNDEDGKTYIYRGGNPTIPNDDEFHKIKATIKHDTYREVKQTLILRVKLTGIKPKKDFTLNEKEDWLDKNTQFNTEKLNDEEIGQYFDRFYKH